MALYLVIIYWRFRCRKTYNSLENSLKDNLKKKKSFKKVIRVGKYVRKQNKIFFFFCFPANREKCLLRPFASEPSIFRYVRRILRIYYSVSSHGMTFG